MKDTNSSLMKEPSARTRSVARKPAAGLVAAALGAALLVPNLASAAPGASTIFPGEGCPSPPGSWRVMCVQWVLDAYTGHEMGDPLDGCYGPITQSAVRDLQNFFDLEPDAKIGPHTGSALDVVMLYNSTDADWNWWNEHCYPYIATTN